jgi:predicted dehydrogenase
MKKLRLGVIGTGMAWEWLHYPAIKELEDKYEIVALANRTQSDAEEFAKKIGLDLKNVYNDYRDLLSRDDIDVVDILVPISKNYIISEETARSGKNVICEKPLAPNLEQARKFTEIPKKYDVKVMIAENFRYNEEMNKIRDILQQGKIGEPIYFIWNEVECFPCRMVEDTYAAAEWRQHPDFRGGAFLDAALHNIAGMRHIFGSVDKVQAFGKPFKEDFNPYMSINANILFQNGMIGQFTYFPTGLEMQKPMVGLRIYGTNGMVYLEDKKSGVINVAYNNGTTEQVKYTPERGYYNELLNFYNAMNGTEEISVTPEIEYGDVKMVFDILKSVEKNEIIAVDGAQQERPKDYIYHNNISEFIDTDYIH